MSNDEQVPGSENEADDVDADIEKFKRARKLKIGFGCILILGPPISSICLAGPDPKRADTVLS